MPTTIAFRGEFDPRTRRWTGRDEPDVERPSATLRIAALALIAVVAITLHVLAVGDATVAGVSDSAFVVLLAP